MTQTKSPAAGPGRGNTSNPHHSKPPAKWRRVLQALLEGRSFNRFEATRDLRDWCLHSTISTLVSKGVKIDRHDEVVPGYQNIPTHVTRYWLSPESHQKASELIGAATPAPVCGHPPGARI